MIEIQAVPHPEINCVRIRIDTDTMVRRIMRETPEGWLNIRTYADTLPAKFVVIEDYEIPLGVKTRYRVQADKNPVKYFEVTLNSPDIVLALPHMPKISAIIPILSNYSDSRKMPGATDLIIGRQDPLVTILPLQKRQGTLEYSFRSMRDAKNVQKMYAMGYPLLLRQPCHEGLDLYHTAESASIQPDPSGKLWKLTVQYVEQNIPGGFLAGSAGWDFLALSIRHPDFVEMESAYKDYANLLMDVML